MNINSIPNIDLISQDVENFSYKSRNISLGLNTSKEIKNVLLTGSTGFLGRYILRDLLNYTKANIYCLVRTDNAKESAKEKFNRKLLGSGLELNDDRIIIIPGRFDAENLGLSNDIFYTLERSIDSIYHCGAFVHHMHTYRTLRQDVIATKFLIDFSLSKTQKQLHYISTMNISNANQDIWRPAANLGDINFCDMGYMQVKWACEKIIYTYISHGYPFYIYRPGNITGDRKTGYSIPWNNHALLLLKGFLQSKIAPEWDDKVEMTPVDLVSKSIVKISLHRSSAVLKNTFNLHNSSTISWISYIQKTSDILKKAIKFVTPDEWRKKVLPATERNNPIILFKDFYSIESNKFNYQPPKDTVTESILKEVQVKFPTDKEYDFLIKIYTEFLLKKRFLS